MDGIVIIGSGLAGYNAARELRKLDRDIPLTVLTADGGEFYSKPTLSNALAANKTPAQIPIHSAEEMAGQLGATVRTRTRVTAIEPGERRVRIGDETLPYSRLVLAVGADQIRLPIAGDAAREVLTVNSLDDYARFRRALEGRRSVAIIGAGLIGCEFANDLAACGIRVDVADLARQPLPRLLPPPAGALLAEKLAALGVNWHFGTSVERVDRKGAGLEVRLGNGEVIAAELVLSAVGLAPKLELARAAGMAVNRGIVVNRYLEAGAPGVHALGDCAEVEGLVLPFVMPIMHAARALAATLAGSRTAVAYPAMPVVVKTPACPTVVAPPPAGAGGEWRIERSADGVKALYVDGKERLLGFALAGAAAAERAKLARELPPVLA
ncbi:MAG TPA: FAD-dependent oxidoreductase [Burkholderiales bacterium]|nr:FAD-dependent oxidoreductase [Burkholderiales bacterium]